MGQYFNALIQSNDETVCISPFLGAKLMEHSFMGDDFADYAVSLLHNAPARIAWVGDLARGYKKPFGHSSESAVDLFEKAYSKSSGTREIGVEDYYGISWDEYYELIKDSNAAKENGFKRFEFDYSGKYLYNHDTKQYISFDEYYQNNACLMERDDESYPVCINPVSLLTAVGNGEEWGDFRGSIGLGNVGLWANDTLEVVDKKPKGVEKVMYLFIYDELFGTPINTIPKSKIKQLASEPQNERLRKCLKQYKIIDNSQIER